MFQDNQDFGKKENWRASIAEEAIRNIAMPIWHDLKMFLHVKKSIICHCVLFFPLAPRL